MAFINYNLQNILKDLVFIAYLRKSSQDREDKQMRSIERQWDDIEELKNELNLNVLEMISEDKSAFEVGREGFSKMMSLIREGRANGVLVWHPSRIARNYEEGGAFVQLMSHKYLAAVVTPMGVFDNNPRDKANLMDEFTKATEDSDIKSEAVISGYRRKLKEGYLPSGRLREGYIHERDDRGRPITGIDELRFPLLRKAIHLVLSGSYSPQEALEILNNDWGYRVRKTTRTGGGPLGRSTWYNYLSSSLLYGDLSEFKNSHPDHDAEFESLLSKEEFDRLQILLGNKGKPRPSKHDFSFKEVLKCGECNGSITAYEKWHIACTECKKKFPKSKQRTSCKFCSFPIDKMKNPKIYHHIHYECTNHKKGNCSQKSINIKDINKKILETIAIYEIPEEFRDWAIEHLNEISKNEITDRKSITTSIDEAIADCEKQIDRLTDLYISPQNTNHELLNESELSRRKKRLLEEKSSLELQRSEQSSRQNNWLELSAKTFDFACYARYWFETGSLKDKTNILAALGSNLVIKDKELLMEQHKPFFLIEKELEKVKNLGYKFEPNKEVALETNKDILELVRTSWLSSMVWTL